MQRRTMYPSGVAVTVDLEFRPIHLILSEDKEPATYVMVTGVPIMLQVRYIFRPSSIREPSTKFKEKRLRSHFLDTRPSSF